jgi:hypothetical protein
MINTWRPNTRGVLIGRVKVSASFPRLVDCIKINISTSLYQSRRVCIRDVPIQECVLGVSILPLSTISLFFQCFQFNKSEMYCIFSICYTLSWLGTYTTNSPGLVHILRTPLAWYIYYTLPWLGTYTTHSPGLVHILHTPLAWYNVPSQGSV